MICDKGMFLLVMAFSFLAAQIVSKQVTILIIDVILKFDIVIIIVIIVKVINPIIISSDKSSCTDDGLLYVYPGHFFRFSLSPLMQLMLQVSL